MAYPIKTKKKKEIGRKPNKIKIRSLEAITPKGFEFVEIKGKQAFYIRKEK